MSDGTEERSTVDLARAAATVGTGDDGHDQVVAFDVARAIRDAGDASSLRALSALLEALRTAPAPASGTLVNVVTALQYAAMLPDETLEGWDPPSGSLDRLLDRALSLDEPMRRQADDLLWALAERRLFGGWLGRRAATVADRVPPGDLRAELERQVATV